MDATKDRMKIGIVGLTCEAGTGFLSSALARYLALRGEKITVLELGKSGLYDALGMDRHFAGRQFFSFHEAVAVDKSIRGRRNDHLGINWMLIPTGSRVTPELDLNRKIRLIYHSYGDVILCRLSGMPEQDLWPLLREMDRIVVMVDPLPSRMLAGYPLLCRLRVSDLPLVYLVNRFNDGVGRKEMLDFLALKHLYYLPAIEAREIYGAEYGCRNIFDMPKVAELLRKPLGDLVQEIFTTGL